MARFIIQPSQQQPDGWVCTDTENAIVCRFKEHQFNETQEIFCNDPTRHPDAQKLATALREMADWLSENHKSIIF